MLFFVFVFLLLFRFPPFSSEPSCCPSCPLLCEKMSLSDRFGSIEKETREKKASDLLRKKAEPAAPKGPAKKKQDASLGRAAKAAVGATEAAPTRVQKRRGAAAAGERSAKPAVSNGQQPKKAAARPAQQKQQPAKKADAAPKKRAPKAKPAPKPKQTLAELDAELEGYAVTNSAYHSRRLDSDLDRYRKEAPAQPAEASSDSKPAAQ